MSGPAVEKAKLIKKYVSGTLKFISASLVDTNPVGSLITDS